MVITREDLSRLWGESNVVRADPGTLTTMGLPPEANRILTDVGLPRHVERVFAAAAPTTLERPGWPRRYCRIGTEPLDWSKAEFFVEIDSNEVLYLVPTREGQDRFVNSSLALFVESLYLDAVERARWSSSDEDEIIRLARGLRQRLERLDPRAFEDPDNYWAVVFEDVRD
jgi:hypothetical protein